MKRLLFLLIPFILYALGRGEMDFGSDTTTPNLVVEHSTANITRVNSLIWQDEKYTLDEEEAYEDNNGKGRSYGKVMNLKEAKRYCKNLTLGSYNNWRLPTKKELKDLQKNKSQLKNSVLFKFWSSSAKYDSDGAWAVGFISGTAMWRDEKKHAYVRCVRD